MFSRPRTKTTAIRPPNKKRKLASAIEEITFDTSAREDYLTGFHKRKVQRVKHAKEEAMKREREDKLAARKVLREGRKADLENHVEAVNSMLREMNANVLDPSGVDNQVEVEQWDGIAEDPILDHEDEYIDDDRFTTVTVEAVNINRDGLHKAIVEDDEAPPTITEEDNGGHPKDSHVTKQLESQGGKRKWTKERPSGPKKKKKKFRYESKAERKVTRYKERSGNKDKAKARKS